jgi:inorganic phosphate transporter, PiT family
MIITAILILSVVLLAYSNGANDNFKGVASLYGSRTTGYRIALGWATITTAAGSLCAIFLAQALLRKFSGKGLVPDELVGSEYFLLSVAMGAGCTVLLATRFGFPISTTHGLTGAMIGSGLVAASSQVKFGVLGRSFVLPLLLSPLLACVLGGMLYAIFHAARRMLRISKETCICVGTEVRILQPAADGLSISPAAGSLTVSVDEKAVCFERYAGSLVGLNCQWLMDSAHFLSAGVVSFARGLNDTPKIAALLLIVQYVDRSLSMTLVAAAMAIGGLIHSRRIAETMSHKITTMNHGQGFSANLATGILVIAASLFGLPVSTTHVSCGALFGIGVTTGQADYKVVTNILLSWVLTLPCAALLSALCYACIAP